jgi:hypothetical protein
MHTKQNVPPDPSAGYERSDLDVSGIGKGTLYFFIFALVCGGIAWGFMRFARPGSTAPPPENPGARTRVVPDQPNPLLQNNITVKTDIWNLRTRENMRLNGRGTDPETGRGYIPIRDAIELEAVRRGGSAPQRPATSGPTGTIGGEIREEPPGASGTGRKPEGTDRPEDQTGGVEAIR